jgi:hypothetical protein
MTATERAAIDAARDAAERAQYGNRPGESVIAATIRQHDPHHGAGFTAADEQAMALQDKAELIDALADRQRKLEALQEQYAALLAEAEFDFNARCALHSQVCRYGQALVLIAHLPIADDGYRAAEQLRTARALADKAIHFAPAVPARHLPAERVPVESA